MKVVRIMHTHITRQNVKTCSNVTFSDKEMNIGLTVNYFQAAVRINLLFAGNFIRYAQPFPAFCPAS